jgi:hypothetical protein
MKCLFKTEADRTAFSSQGRPIVSDNILNRPAANERGDQGESTLLPMLIAGLVLIVIGAVVVMTFV